MSKELIPLIKNEIFKFAALLRANKNIYNNNNRVCGKFRQDNSFAGEIQLLLEPDWLFEIEEFSKMKSEAYPYFKTKKDWGISFYHAVPYGCEKDDFRLFNQWNFYRFNGYWSYRQALKANVTALHILLTQVKGKKSHVSAEKDQYFAEHVRYWKERMEKQFSEGCSNVTST